MKKILTTAFATLALVTTGFSQPGASLPPRTNLCETDAWQLVFVDEFNGSSLDLTKWYRYTIAAGLEDELYGWCHPVGKYSFARNANVVVSGGTCKLIQKRETVTFQCATCPAPETRDYTAGVINTSYAPGKGFRRGKFEARIKFPSFKKAHCTFWTWSGADGSVVDVPEIDVAEAYGDGNSPVILGLNSRYTNYGMHRWMAGTGSSFQTSDKFPNQSFWDGLAGNYFDQREWHNYVSEWDSNRVAFYLDGTSVNTFYRYYTWTTSPFVLSTSGTPSTYMYKVPARCLPGSTSVFENPAFLPWSEVSNVRLNTDIDDPTSATGTLGQMEIDYVKVWQRNPALDGHQNICPGYGTIPVITGVNTICSSYNYNVWPNTPMSWWSWSPNLTATVTSPAYIGVSIAYPGAFGPAWIKYHYKVGEDCPIEEVLFPISLGPPSPAFYVNAYLSSGTGYSPKSYFLSVTAPLAAPGTTYEWWIDYGAGGGSSYPYSYHTFGTSVSTPAFFGDDPKIKWKVTATNSCGSTTKYGSKSSGGSFKMLAPTAFSIDSNKYFNMTVQDSASFNQRVRNRVASTTIESLDTIVIRSAITKIIIEELEKENGVDSIWSDGGGNYRYVLDSPVHDSVSRPASTTMFPNPTSGTMSIALSNAFREANLPVTVTVRDVGGRTVLQKIFGDPNAISLELYPLANGVYILELANGFTTERLRMFKE